MKKETNMKVGKTWLALLFAVMAMVAGPSSAAYLSISETANGVVFSGDCGFNCNDWLGGAVQTQFGLERATLSVGLFNPNGGDGAQLYTIFDPNGATSDALFMSWLRGPAGGSSGIFNAMFCSGDVSACQAEANGWTATAVAAGRAFEDAAGNFGFAASFDPNFAGGGNSPEHVPEPASLALVGLGLLAAGVVRRKTA